MLSDRTISKLVFIFLLSIKSSKRLKILKHPMWIIINISWYAEDDCSRIVLIYRICFILLNTGLKLLFVLNTGTVSKSS